MIDIYNLLRNSKIDIQFYCFCCDQNVVFQKQKEDSSRSHESYYNCSNCEASAWTTLYSPPTNSDKVTYTVHQQVLYTKDKKRIQLESVFKNGKRIRADGWLFHPILSSDISLPTYMSSNFIDILTVDSYKDIIPLAQNYLIM